MFNYAYSIKKFISNAKILFLKSNFYNKETFIYDFPQKTISEQTEPDFANIKEQGKKQKITDILFLTDPKYFTENLYHKNNDINIIQAKDKNNIYSLALLTKPSLIVAEINSSNVLKDLKRIKKHHSTKDIPIITIFKNKYDRNIEETIFLNSIVYIESNNPHNLQNFNNLVTDTFKKQSKTILIADDDLIVREMINIYLRKEGYQTILASDGLEAKQMFYNHQPDLAIIDIMMPYQDGISVIGEVQTNIKNCPPVIILTIKVQHENILNGLKLNVFDYISKPFDLVVLLEKIKLALKKNEIQNI